jgi:hypothetical protein
MAVEKPCFANEDVKLINDKINSKLHFLWEKMGDTGGDDYFQKATNQELIYFGMYRALEDLQMFMESHLKDLDEFTKDERSCPICNVGKNDPLMEEEYVGVFTVILVDLYNVIIQKME